MSILVLRVKIIRVKIIQNQSGKVALILIVVLAAFLIFLTLQNRMDSDLQTEVPPCGDPKIILQLPKYNLVPGEQATLTGDLLSFPPPRVAIDEGALVPYKQLVSGLPVQETLVKPLNSATASQVYPHSSQSKDPNWQKVTFPNGDSFAIYYPAGQGYTPTATNLVSENILGGDVNKRLYFADWGLVFLVHLKNNEPETTTRYGDIFWIADLYQDINYRVIPVDTGLFECSFDHSKNGSLKDPNKEIQVDFLAPIKTVKEWYVN